MESRFHSAIFDADDVLVDYFDVSDGETRAVAYAKRKQERVRG